MSKNIDNPMAGATPDDSPNQTINELLCDGTILIGYGKRGHGMNGRDADLDRIGQCLVTELVTEDPVGADTMRVAINLRLYASICAPSHDGIEFSDLHEWWSPELKEFFKDYHEVDIDAIDWENWDDPATEKATEEIVDHFRDQATHIVCGADPCPGDPFAFMWDGDGSWDGGTDVTLHVPLTVDEYDRIEGLRGIDERLASQRRAIGDAALADDPKAIRAAAREFAESLKVQKQGKKALDKVADRIATEIYDANKGGTPERDRLKRFEEEVGLCNDQICQLECYRPRNVSK